MARRTWQRKFAGLRRSLGVQGTVSAVAPSGDLSRPCFPPRRKVQPAATSARARRSMSLLLLYISPPALAAVPPPRTEGYGLVKDRAVTAVTARRPLRRQHARSDDGQRLSQREASGKTGKSERAAQGSAGSQEAGSGAAAFRARYNGLTGGAPGAHQHRQAPPATRLAGGAAVRWHGMKSRPLRTGPPAERKGHGAARRAARVWQPRAGHARRAGVRQGGDRRGCDAAPEIIEP